MNRSTINHSDKSKQGQASDSASKDQEGKQRYVDQGSMTINDTHVSFVKPEELQRLDARESLEVPLVSSYDNGEVVDENGVATEPLPVPGITQPLGPPSMPDPDRVSELPESRRERRYMIEKTHKQPAGPHVVIDTPIPSGTPSVDTLSPEIQRNSSLHDNSETAVELEPIAVKEAPPHRATAETILKVVGLEKSYRKASIVIPVLR
ncbi:MAG: hypothetical protein PVH19_10735, partial [Planctomycetia bacterium]